MATNIAKALYQAPVGIDVEEDVGPLEIELESDDDEEGITVEIDVESPEFAENLADKLDEGYLTKISSDLLDSYKEDLNSRKDWEEMLEQGFDLLGLKYEDRSEPWDGACGVYHPMVAEAMVRFQAEMIMETVPATGPVKTEIIGAISKLKNEIAERVRDDMNYRLMNDMTEWRPDQERLYWYLPFMGSAFKKVYFDPSLDRQTSVFISADDIIVNYGEKDLETAQRVTHRMRKHKNDLRKLQVSGFYRDIELPEPTQIKDKLKEKRDELEGIDSSSDDRYPILEIQTYLDIEGYEDLGADGEPTGIELPYIVTLIDQTGEVLSIRRNWRETDPVKKARTHFVHYPYVPGFGFYGLGLIHLIGGYAKSATSIMRQLVDAGTLANLPGGLKSRGLRVTGDDTPIQPGEFRDVDVPGGSIRDNILPLPYKEPSQVLQSLLGTIVDEGRRFAVSVDMNVSDMSQQAPVGTTLAILERTLKVMSAVQARVHYAMKQEFKLLKEIIKDCMPDEYEYDVEGGPGLKKSDYEVVEILPVSDPNAATMAQRVMQHQAALQLAATAPQIYDMPYLHRAMLHELGMKDTDKIIPDKDDIKPLDPVAENMNILNAKPVKAFAYQNHQAHIQVHMAAMTDPKLAQMMGQNPMANQLMAAAQAHIAEHMAFEYRKQIEETIGVPLPPPDEPLPSDVEYQLSSLMAQAAQQLQQKNQAEMAQQQAQQQAQDPVLQAQQQELQIKKAEVDRKAAKDKAEMDLREQDLQLRHQRELERLQSSKETVAIQTGAQLEIAQARIQSAEEIAGAKIGVEAAKVKHGTSEKSSPRGVQGKS